MLLQHHYTTFSILQSDRIPVRVVIAVVGDTVDVAWVVVSVGGHSHKGKVCGSFTAIPLFYQLCCG